MRSRILFLVFLLAVSLAGCRTVSYVDLRGRRVDPDTPRFAQLRLNSRTIVVYRWNDNDCAEFRRHTRFLGDDAVPPVCGPTLPECPIGSGGKCLGGCPSSRDHRFVCEQITHTIDEPPGLGQEGWPVGASGPQIFTWCSCEPLER